MLDVAVVVTGHGSDSVIVVLVVTVGAVNVAGAILPHWLFTNASTLLSHAASEVHPITVWSYIVHGIARILKNFLALTCLCWY